MHKTLLGFAGAEAEFDEKHAKELLEAPVDILVPAALELQVRFAGWFSHCWRGVMAGVSIRGTTPALLSPCPCFPAQITRANAGRIQASIIAEGANGPVTAAAEDILLARGVVVLPDILMNSGGVFCSYLECVKNLQVRCMWGARARADPSSVTSGERKRKKKRVLSVEDRRRRRKK